MRLLPAVPAFAVPIGLLLVAGFLGERLAAQEPAVATSAVTIHAETQLVSRYMWRGYDLSRGRPALQPYVEVGLPHGFGANAFSTVALDRQTEIDEGQLGLTFTRELGGKVEAQVGYLAYLMPGTQTEPSANANNGLAFSSSGEWYLAVTRSWDAGSATLTYSRGQGSSAGNSVNLWVERTFGWGGDHWQAAPYLQVDYLDQYGAPAVLRDRLAGVEAGVPIARHLGGVSVGVSAHLTWVPSNFVRAANAAAGASAAALIPWIAIGVTFERP